jgi:hypothetical protein
VQLPGENVLERNRNIRDFEVRNDRGCRCSRDGQSTGSERVLGHPKEKEEPQNFVLSQPYLIIKLKDSFGRRYTFKINTRNQDHNFTYNLNVVTVPVQL